MLPKFPPSLSTTATHVDEDFLEEAIIDDAVTSIYSSHDAKKANMS